MQEVQPFFIDSAGLVKYSTLSKSKIYQLEKGDPSFPKRIKISEKRSAYIFSEVKNWAENIAKTATKKAIKGSDK